MNKSVENSFYERYVANESLWEKLFFFVWKRKNLEKHISSLNVSKCELSFSLLYFMVFLWMVSIRNIVVKMRQDCNNFAIVIVTIIQELFGSHGIETHTTSNSESKCSIKSNNNKNPVKMQIKNETRKEDGKNLNKNRTMRQIG